MLIASNIITYCSSTVGSDSRSGFWSNQLFQESFILSKAFLLPPAQTYCEKWSARVSFFITFSPFPSFWAWTRAPNLRGWNILLSWLSETFRAFCIFMPHWLVCLSFVLSIMPSGGLQRWLFTNSCFKITFTKHQHQLLQMHLRQNYHIIWIIKAKSPMITFGAPWSAHVTSQTPKILGGVSFPHPTWQITQISATLYLWVSHVWTSSVSCTLKIFGKLIRKLFQIWFTRKLEISSFSWYKTNY